MFFLNVTINSVHWQKKQKKKKQQQQKKKKKNTLLFIKIEMILCIVI